MLFLIFPCFAMHYALFFFLFEMVFGGRRTGAIFELRSPTEWSQGSGDTRTHCPTGRPSSHPQRQRGGLGTGCTVCRNPGWPGSLGESRACVVSLATGETLHLLNKAPLSLQLCGREPESRAWEGCWKPQVMRLTGQIKPMVCDINNFPSFP